MANNFLMLNAEKTDVLLPIMPVNIKKVQCNISLDSCSVVSSSTDKNLGVLLPFFHLRNTSKLRPIVSASETEKLIHAFYDLTNRLL